MTARSLDPFRPGPRTVSMTVPGPRTVAAKQLKLYAVHPHRASPGGRSLRDHVVRLFPRCLYRLAGCTGRTGVVDHWYPIEAGGSPTDVFNMVASCAHCHSILTMKFDAVNRRPGNTRPGKPDPRDADFRRKMTAIASDPRVRRWQGLPHDEEMLGGIA